jgi:cysteine desulfurase
MRAYLDYNATAPIWPEVRAAVADALGEPGNPSAVHGAGRAARARIEAAREAVAALMGAKPAQIVFTSGGTEANALAIKGLAASGAVERIIVSAIEHPSVMEAARASGLPLSVLPVSGDGVVALEALALQLKEKGRALVCLMAANNETGVIQPIAEAIRLGHEAGALIHVDAVQTAGRGEVAALAGADLISISAHKLGGPQGAGALVIRTVATLTPLFGGGGQERRRRAGTENLPGIAGFGAAVQKTEAIAAVQTRIAALRDRLETGVLALAPSTIFFGANAQRLANTSSFATPGIDSALKVMALDLAGIAVSAGAACSSGKVERSPVLSAMGAGQLAGEAIRVSLGWHTREEEIDIFLEAYGAFLAQYESRRRAGR